MPTLSVASLSGRFGRFEIRAFVPALVGAFAVAWIAACGSSDPASTMTSLTYGGVADAGVPLDSSSSDDPTTLDIDASDASTGPVQSFRDPDSGAAVCSAPNMMCPVVAPPSATVGDAGDDDAGGDDDDDAAATSAPDAAGAKMACVAVVSDPQNCGACGTVCLGGGATCIGGKCACSGALTGYCAAGCIDLSSDANNCGACGNVCGDGQSCNAGACVDCDDCKERPNHQ